jgi:hypothetical protein
MQFFQRVIFYILERSSPFHLVCPSDLFFYYGLSDPVAHPQNIHNTLEINPLRAILPSLQLSFHLLLQQVQKFMILLRICAHIQNLLL